MKPNRIAKGEMSEKNLNPNALSHGISRSSVLTVQQRLHAPLCPAAAAKSAAQPPNVDSSSSRRCAMPAAAQSAP